MRRAACRAMGISGLFTRRPEEPARLSSNSISTGMAQSIEWDHGWRWTRFRQVEEVNSRASGSSLAPVLLPSLPSIYRRSSSSSSPSASSSVVVFRSSHHSLKSASSPDLLSLRSKQGTARQIQHNSNSDVVAITATIVFVVHRILCLHPQRPNRDSEKTFDRQPNVWLLTQPSPIVPHPFRTTSAPNKPNARTPPHLPTLCPPAAAACPTSSPTCIPGPIILFLHTQSPVCFTVPLPQSGATQVHSLFTFPFRRCTLVGRIPHIQPWHQQNSTRAPPRPPLPPMAPHISSSSTTF